MLRRCPYCSQPVSLRAILKYRLARSAQPLRCMHCGSEISYAFAPGLVWPATSFGLALLASKAVLGLTGGSLLWSLLAFGVILLLMVLVVYYTTPLKNG